MIFAIQLICSIFGFLLFYAGLVFLLVNTGDPWLPYTPGERYHLYVQSHKVKLLDSLQCTVCTSQKIEFNINSIPSTNAERFGSKYRNIFKSDSEQSQLCIFSQKSFYKQCVLESQQPLMKEGQWLKCFSFWTKNPTHIWCLILYESIF